MSSYALQLIQHTPQNQPPGAEAALLNFEGLAGFFEFAGDAPGARAAFAAGMRARRPLSARFLREAALFEKRAGSPAAAAALFERAAAAGEGLGAGG